ncbi:MAG: hypothetical protein FWB84_07400 [Candidatus Bathyarchaeota archaeon]|uniref:hypothetical protein n=1 Tax=Candidatus Bathycorpusculum sp. TaxID=2994959 RepID=UPI00282736D0|nr:hypothetical protein [Candidatus Termiticorpusculum sp.]MCL2258118.1 hypothetical protein [Candidatus Termiticorpusculum sp.]MCL2291599.1 hypothetical protein [Candidatus Termiticorpusculum sp.]
MTTTPTNNNNNNCKDNRVNTVRLGKNEKCVLLLMLKGDKPKGCSNPIWLDIALKFKIDYSSLSKKSQHLKFRQERTLRQTLYRLTVKGLIVPSVVMPLNSSSIASPKKYGHNFYSLTPKGRQIAENLQQQQELALKDLEALQTALSALLALGHNNVTAEQVRNVLWQSSTEKFVNRAEFDAYWNNTRLGVLLQKSSCGRIRVGFNNRHRKYFLT